MTGAEIYDSVTNGCANKPTKRKKDELDLMRIAEARPELRRSIPAEIVKQL
jgi:hypothetical protein